MDSVTMSYLTAHITGLNQMLSDVADAFRSCGIACVVPFQGDRVLGCCRWYTLTFYG